MVQHVVLGSELKIAKSRMPPPIANWREAMIQIVVLNSELEIAVIQNVPPIEGAQWFKNCFQLRIEDRRGAECFPQLKIEKEPWCKMLLSIQH